MIRVGGRKLPRDGCTVVVMLAWWTLVKGPFGEKKECLFIPLRQQTEQKAIKTVNKQAVLSVVMAAETMDV
jgi:hypothetical protein